MFSSSLVDDLKNPPKTYRPIPFWSWNERLDVAETRRQIAEMDRVGIGGYFMHARGGLQTGYMGEDWMANIAAGIDEARERGMGAWAYDENGWPSGFGDGRVNGRGEVLQQKYLRHEVVEEETTRGDGRTIACVALEDGRILHFYYDVNPFYVDTLDAEATRVFIEQIYAPYHEHFGEDFGGAMPGFFTDEPQISRNGIPWSLTLPDQYAEHYGEDLIPLLPGLVMETEQCSEIRFRFWQLVRELFVTGFTQQIYNWCTEHNCQLTGHMVLEETLQSQLTSNGAVMPHYEFFHLPGIDWLGRHIDPSSTPLQAASVVHQLGEGRLLSETFALTGWNVTFEELKWMFEWQMVRGVTQLCQHLEGYSLRGIRKRDYPPSLFFQQPWWGDQYRFFNDAMTRVGMLLARGEADFDVMVVHPQSSAWVHFNNDSNPGLADFQKQFSALTRALEAAHIPFDLGDERIIERHGNVEDDRFVVGSQSYTVVIVPAVETLAHCTVELLQRYVDGGGQLIWAGQKPTLVDGSFGPSLVSLCAQGCLAPTPGDVVSTLSGAVRPISVADVSGREIPAIGATWRRLPTEVTGTECRFLFFANSDTAQEYDATIRVPGEAAARFVVEDGSIKPLAAEAADGCVLLRHTFPPMGSLALFVADVPDAFGHAAEVEAPAGEQAVVVPDGQAWRMTLLDPNALTLDLCDIRFDGQLVAEKEHVSVVQKRALDLERPVDIELCFAVEVGQNGGPDGELFLVLETPGKFAVEINGEPLPQKDCGCYRDTSFRKLDISGRLVPGRNNIVLKTRFEQDPAVYENLRRAQVFEAEKNKLTYDTEIEAIYLVGNFGVRTPGSFEQLPRGATRYHGDFVIDAVPDVVSLGDLVPQGLPFFNGTVRLQACIDVDADTAAGSPVFRFSEKMANSVALRVNGRSVRDWFWRPYEADLSGLLAEGENTIELELTTGLRNLLGPHHLEEGETYGCAPRSFFKEPNIWGNQPWNDDYCFVRFGIGL